ncbi:MAG: hypothetical protein IT328_23010 [Caldilineaceae bacterium]|nr:hypothetical protein [Caldilineaceae bacterium]
MKTLRMYAASDDLIEVKGIEGADEYTANMRDNSPFMATFEVRSESEDASIEIHIVYTGSWAFAVTPKDGPEYPAWAMRRTWGTIVDYSETLEVFVPDDAIIRRSR